MRVVLDTNVVLAGLLNPNGPPAQILSLLIAGKVQSLYDNRILQEYIEVLHRQKFGFKKEWIEAFVEYVKEEGEYIAAEPTNKPFVDDDDRAFYEVAATSGADYLITGNKSHFPRESWIKNPRDFITTYEKRTERK